MIELILGGARSGKSRYAEQQAIKHTGHRFYFATAQALDEEMQQRITRHQKDRDTQWITIEEPIHLAVTLQAYDQAGACIVVDCLTLWLTNCLLDQPQTWQTEKAALLACLANLQADIYLVSNEVGLGIIPLDALSRQFVDEAGWLHQRLATLCDKVTFVAAGLPLTLKGNA